MSPSLELFIDFYVPLVMGTVFLGSGIYFHREWKRNEYLRGKIKYKYLLLLPLAALYMLGYALYHLPLALKNH